MKILRHSACFWFRHNTFSMYRHISSDLSVGTPRFKPPLMVRALKHTTQRHALEKKKNHKRRQPLLNVNVLSKCASMIHILSHGEESRVSKIYRFNKTRFKRSAYARQVMKKDPEFSQQNYYSLYI